MKKNAIINSILNGEALKLGKLMGIYACVCHSSKHCSRGSHLKREWTQWTQTIQNLAQALWVIFKGTTLSSHLSDFLLTWRMLSKILESEWRATHATGLQPSLLSSWDRTLRKGASIPEKDSRQKDSLTERRPTVLSQEEKSTHTTGRALVSAPWELHEWLTRDSYVLG